MFKYFQNREISPDFFEKTLLITDEKEILRNTEGLTMGVNNPY